MVRLAKRMNRVRVCHGISWYAVAVLSGCLASTLASSGALPTFTVADAIETTRFHEDRKGQSVFLSPDQRFYVALTIQGDVKNDGIWLNVLCGDLSSMSSAVPRTVARYFTSGLPATGPVIEGSGGTPALLAPGENIPVWVSDEAIAYLWADSLGHSQVFRLNVVSGKLTQLTHETMDVVAFVVHPNGSVVYDTKVPHPSDRSREFYDGFAVKSPDITTLLSGIVDGTSLYDFEMCDRSMVAASGGPPRPVPASRIKCELSALIYSPKIISPNGKRLLVNAHVQRIPDEWAGYGGHFGALLKIAQQNLASNTGLLISQFEVVDMVKGTHRELWTAPDGLVPWSLTAWSPDSTRVLVAPALLPGKENDAAALAGEAVALVDADTGDYERVPLDPEIAANISLVEWPMQNKIVLSLRDGRSVELVRSGKGWHAMTPEDGHSSGTRSPSHDAKIEVSVAQGLEQPPVLMAKDLRTGRSDVIFDPNPNLSTGFALGHVEMIHWVDSAGSSWEGRLYYPAHYRSGMRYPLVIQTHGYAGSDEFSIYGQGGRRSGVALGPGWSVFLAQPLASQDIVVLQVAGSEHPPEETDFVRAQRNALALADAAKHLIDMGLVDKNKVGIMGHSATGRAIEAALAFTDFPYAAAIAADNYELSYTQSMYLGWDVIEGQPPAFGEDLEQWFNFSPAFHAERIRTPLQMELTTGAGETSTLVYPWELFSRLRYLKKPVEYYVLPDIRHGSHLVQNPRQLMILQGRAMDWWLFWLKSAEDPAASKTQQYQDWRALRALHIADIAKPRTPRMTWKSAPSIN